MKSGTPPRPNRLRLEPASGGLGAPIEEVGGVWRMPFYPLWRTVSLLLVLVCFLMLQVTGELAPSISVAFTLLWVAAWFIKRPPKWWSRQAGAIFVIAVLAWLVMQAREAFFSSVLYLLLFLLLVKCFTLLTARDFLHVQVLSFFVVLAAAVITVNFVFAFFFIPYLLLATMGLTLYGMARRQEPSGARRADGTEKAVLDMGYLPGRFLNRSWLSAALMFGFVIFFFYSVPHISIQQINAPFRSARRQPESITGFSEEVTLGAFKRINPDPTVVMRVELDWPRGSPANRPEYLRMRGVVLDRFESNRWTRTERRGQLATRVEKSEIFNPKVHSVQPSRITHQKIYQNPSITLRIFTASYPMEISFMRPLHLRFDQATATAQISSFGQGRDSAYTDPLIYGAKSKLVGDARPLLLRLVAVRKRSKQRMADALSRINDEGELEKVYDDIRSHSAEPSSALRLLTGFSDRLPPIETLINTQRPYTDLIARIDELSRRFSRGATRAETVLNALDYLEQNFEYTVEPGTPPGADPFEAFLFQTYRGHCEFLATALVLMLRSQDIPARLINGFYTTEWNDLAQVFVVRQSDAHSWVEVWLDETGWLTVDPTPPASAGRGVYGEEEPSLRSRWGEYARALWQRQVIDYSQDQQLRLLDQAKERFRFKALVGLVANARDFVFSSGPLDEAEEQAARREHTSGWIIELLILAGIGAIAWGLIRKLRGSSRRARSQSDVDYFNLLMRRLEKLGWVRSPEQTPAEFLESMRESRLGYAQLAWLIDLYYRQRFAGQAPSAEERKRAFEIVRSLRPAPASNRA